MAASSSSSPAADQLSHQLKITSLTDSPSSRNILSKNEIIQADRLIRELHVYAESKKRGTKLKNRNLVYANRYEVPLFDSNISKNSNNKSNSPTSVSNIQPSASPTVSTAPATSSFTVATTTNESNIHPHQALSRLEKTQLKKDKKEQEKQIEDAKKAADAAARAAAKPREGYLNVTSWKMNEFEYSRGSMPTLARGLFTYEDTATPAPVHKNPVVVPESAIDADAPILESGALAKGTHRILIRGYDKFFNIGEVEKTGLEWLTNNTEGPYEVTLKENGCIIFMAGLPPQLAGSEGGCVVSSKHSLGSLDHLRDQANNGSGPGSDLPEVSHSAKGREWLEKSLIAKGKTLQEFGRWLYENNLTAVAELCDDSFEEHVLEYPAEKAGLYLHGLNRNTAEFQTMPSKQVQEVAREWGLWPTEYVTFSTQKEVMEFADKVRNAGEYDSRPVEGFVVRCKIKNTGGQTHFFKIKYDEPYLMYREWREVTKSVWAQKIKKEKEEALAAAKNKNKDVAIESAQDKAKKDEEVSKKIRMRYPLTKAYVEFIMPLMKSKPELFSNYNKNQGIIAIRDMFLQQWNTKSLSEQENALVTSQTSTVASSTGAVEDFQRTVIIPIATIGCGKTTVSVALSKLFGWGHVSSDDFQHLRKNPGQKFVGEVANQLKKHTIVIADRNNHEYLHRERIMSSVKAQFPKTRFVALYWSHDELPQAQIREMNIDRVKKRGNNHQNLTPEYCPDFEFVIQKFLKGFVPLNTFVEPDSNFSVVIETKVGEDSLKTVERVIKEFVIPTLGAGKVGNHAIPTSDEVKEAVRYALEDWKPKRVANGEAERFFKEKQQPQQEITVPGVGDVNATPVEAITTAAAKAKKAREPKYFGVLLEPGAVQQFLSAQFEVDFQKHPSSSSPSSSSSLPSSSSSGIKAAENIMGGKTSKQWIQLQAQIKEFKEENRIGPSQHVTVVHSSARTDPAVARSEKAKRLWQEYMDEMEHSRSGSSSSTTPPKASSPSSPTLPQASRSPEVGKQVQKPSGGVKEETHVIGKNGGKKQLPPSPSTSKAGAPSPSSAAATPLPPPGSVTEGEPDLLCSVTVDSIVWTGRVIILSVSNLQRTGSGRLLQHTQPQLHITVGTLNDQVKPYESNEVLKQLKQNMKNNRKQPAVGGESKGPPEVSMIRLQKPKIFTGMFKSMMW
ncbi:hypothetical protein BG004_007687 [Podila humilis]|nr:hypothetical protein BG004_007687 [Podila humilis]